MAELNTHRVAGARFVEREHTVPLDQTDASRGTITVFTREIVADDGDARPRLLFLQGGPGFEATRPTSPPSGWMKRALADFRIVLMDQRGTGRSTPVTSELPGASADEQADYLKNFRADSIVRDAEHIRQELGIDRWSVLGQSFGGFCTMTYLSIAPHGLREAFITGGVSPVARQVDEIYSRTWAKTLQKNYEYFGRYPGDRQRVVDILRRLENEDVRLPNGDRLTARRFRQLGGWLGDSAGWELLHHVIELPFGSNAFLSDVESGAMRFARNPIYFSIHEACYADGVASNWSAARTMPTEIEAEGLLSAEHVFPWMSEDYGALRGHREAAEILAHHVWPRLYDEQQLRLNEVPVAATIYVNDLYVDRGFAEETAAAIRGLRPWITNEYEHNGLRADGDRVLGRLIDLARGRV